jgi:nanoRNase/pAp phosphatase (c-di-AMP/oligoRNAs hydrolase)
MFDEKFRLVTRSDFDGLVCAVLLRELGMVDEIKFVHPKDMQDGKIEITDRDITTNLPYVPSAYMVFDHHLSEKLRNTEPADNHIIDPAAPSAARVVYNYYGAGARFPVEWSDMMDAVDKGDSARFRREEVLDPSGWVLLNFIMDARTGLGRFHDFRISNYQLMMELIEQCRTLSIEEIMELPDVRERVKLYFEHAEQAKAQIQRCVRQHGELVVLDLRDEDPIYAVNRFMIYALFPQANISLHVLWGVKRQNTVFAIGKSILNRSSDVNIGELCLAYGGGGHLNAGTCQVENEEAAAKLEEIITKITGGPDAGIAAAAASGAAANPLH